MRNTLPNFAVPQVPDLDDSTAQDFLQKHVDQIGQHVTRVQQALAKMPDIRSIGHVCEFRLSAQTGVPVPSEFSNATTLYCAPYKGNRIALYDGKTWPVYESVEFSIAVPATTSTMYDVFCYAKSGVPTLEVLAWTNDTTRATALTTQNGVLVKTGDTSRRYLGSFRTTGTSGQTEDSLAKRYVWNYYNRVRREMRVTDASSWNYTLTTIRQANGNTADQLDYVIGYAEDMVSAETYVQVSNSGGGTTANSGIGLDSTTAYTTGMGQGSNRTLGGAGAFMEITSSVKLFPSVGRHTLVWLESSQASGTTTWNGTNGGIHGELLG